MLTLDVSTSEAPLLTQAQASAVASCPEQLPAARYAPRAAGTRVSPSRGAAGFRAPVCMALSAAAGCRRYPALAPLWAVDVSMPARQPPCTVSAAGCVPAGNESSAVPASAAAVVMAAETRVASHDEARLTTASLEAAVGAAVKARRLAARLHAMLPRRWVVCAAASACRDCSKSCPVAVWQVTVTCGIAVPVTKRKVCSCYRYHAEPDK